MRSRRSDNGCAGIDGCARGWVVASVVDGLLSAEVVAHLGGLLDRFDVIGIDMPIGLPDVPPREADVAARRFVSPRGSSVFPALPRPLLDAPNHRDANVRSRERYGIGVSVQAFMLAPRIREVDELVDPSLDDHLVEVHPECSFRQMLGSALPSKHTDDGLAARRLLLTDHFGTLPSRPRGCADHDLLDAAAALWSAQRFARGVHVTLPALPPPRDARGLPMRIVV